MTAGSQSYLVEAAGVEPESNTDVAQNLQHSSALRADGPPPRGPQNTMKSARVSSDETRVPTIARADSRRDMSRDGLVSEVAAALAAAHPSAVAGALREAVDERTLVRVLELLGRGKMFG